MQDTQVQSLGWEDSLEKGIATHCSVPFWRIPCTHLLSSGCCSSACYHPALNHSRARYGTQTPRDHPCSSLPKSNCPIRDLLSLLTLPYPFLPVKTTIRSFAHAFPSLPCLTVLPHVVRCGVPCLLLLGIYEYTNFFLYDSHFRLHVAKSRTGLSDWTTSYYTWLKGILKQTKNTQINKSGAYFKTSMSFPK